MQKKESLGYIYSVIEATWRGVPDIQSLPHEKHVEFGAASVGLVTFRQDHNCVPQLYYIFSKSPE